MNKIFWSLSNVLTVMRRISFIGRRSGAHGWKRMVPDSKEDLKTCCRLRRGTMQRPAFRRETFLHIRNTIMKLRAFSTKTPEHARSPRARRVARQSVEPTICAWCRSRPLRAGTVRAPLGLRRRRTGFIRVRPWPKFPSLTSSHLCETKKTAPESGAVVNL